MKSWQLLGEGIDRLWAEGEDDETIALLRRFIRELYRLRG